MSLADRIHDLRKLKGISQEVLADKVGVSRQAVSKWESEQSTPDLDKIIIMSEFFDVTTDYILKGIESTKQGEEKSNALSSKILYIASTSFIVIGLLSAFASWHERQSADSIWGSMIIQVVGVAAYFIGKLISREIPGILIKRLNVIIALFIPISLMVTFASRSIVAPYPTGFSDIIAFSVVYIVACPLIIFALERLEKRQQEL